MTDLGPAPGFVEPRLRAEFPGLRLDWLGVSLRQRESTHEVVQRLESLSNRYRGASVVAMRTQAVPQAYRTFFRHIGLDPDATRTPIEEVAVARLLHGQFRSRGLLQDALLIALVETGVPVWALDAEVVDVEGLGIRTSERKLVVADPRSVHAVLFGGIAPGHEVTPVSRDAVLFAVGVDGVPAIHIEEALWICVEALDSE